MHWLFRGFVCSGKSCFVAAVFFQVGIKDHLIGARFRNADAVFLVLVRRKVKDPDDLAAGLADAPESDRGIGVVIAGNPAEPFPAVIDLPKFRVVFIKMV